MKFITDEQRKYALKAVASHVKRKDSLLIIGAYGSGKTELLKQLRITNAVRVRPLGGVYQILGAMCQIADAKPRNKDKYLDMLCAYPRPIIIDEAQHLPEGLFPYLKIIMDAGCPLILAARESLHENLRTKHADVLSRMTVIPLSILGYEDMNAMMPDFIDDSFSCVYTSMSNMREMMTVVKNCRDYAGEHGLSTIDDEVISQFVNVGE
jgi:ABC-type dipeptide/oligopeptide/nickel transport system ATPase component